MSESDYFESRELFAPLFPSAKSDGMTEPIKPALTPEEWAAFAFWHDKARVGIDAEALAVDQVHYVETEYYEGAKRHALAALALYGQPFGFSREDVRMLRNLGNDLTRSQHAYADGEFYLNLADRIAALLPEKE